MSGNMKKCVLLLMSVILVLCFTSCAWQKLPDTVTIEEKEYKRAFIGELYPLFSYSWDDAPYTQGVLFAQKSYYPYPQAAFDCYIANNTSGKSNVYFESTAFDKAVSYYKNPDNFHFYCMIGNMHDEDQRETFEIQDIDAAMFDRLIAYCAENAYNPLTSYNNENDLRKVPISTDGTYMDDEIRFYKESNEGAFASSKGYIFKLVDHQLYLLFHYSFKDKENPVMFIRDVPTDIGDYFKVLAQKLQNK